MGLKINKLHIGYLICAYILGLIIMPLFITITGLGYLIGEHWAILMITSQVQSAILLGALPVSAFVYLWLEKGGGSAYLESWNMGKKLRIVGFLLLSGFLINVALVTIDALTLWNFSTMRVEIEHGVTRVPNQLYFGLFGTACILILSGTVVFSSLWLRKSKLLA